MKLFKYTALLIIYSAQASAVPSGADLLKACELSQQNDFAGIEGQICIWYVTACDCNIRKPELPAVCLPDDISIEELSRRVIKGLKQQQHLQELDADIAAAKVLVKDFPCADENLE